MRLSFIVGVMEVTFCLRRKPLSSSIIGADGILPLSQDRHLVSTMYERGEAIRVGKVNHEALTDFGEDAGNNT